MGAMGLWGRNGGYGGYGAEMVLKRVIYVETLFWVKAARLLECFFWGGGGQGGFYPFGPFSFIDGTTVVRTKGCLGGPPEGVPKHVSVHQI
jgi:hypothetical protein